MVRREVEKARKQVALSCADLSNKRKECIGLVQWTEDVARFCVDVHLVAKDMEQRAMASD